MKTISKITILTLALTTSYPAFAVIRDENVSMNIPSAQFGVMSRSTSSLSGTNTPQLYPSRTWMGIQKSDATYISWNSENDYWRSNYSSRPYYKKNRDYSMYEPAYRYGLDTYNQYPGQRYSDLDQNRLRRGWEQAKGNSKLAWEDAKDAVRDAYNRLNRNMSASANANTNYYDNR